MNLMNHKDRYFGAFVFSESMVPVPVISKGADSHRNGLLTIRF